MPLTKFVKVGNISNLSDARYCAGMGVDMLGFRTIEGQKNYLGPTQFQEIRGWIAGPKIVAEVYGIKKQEDITSVIEDYQPDYLELSFSELSFIQPPSIPLILSVSVREISEISMHPLWTKVSHLLLTDFANNIELPTDIPVLLELNAIELEKINLPSIDYGIALNGSPEISPGLKSYDQLADVLEKLEAD